MTPQEELDAFIDRYEPAIAAITRESLAILRQRCPGAVIGVYDNYNALAVGFAPTHRIKDVVFSIAAYPRWVSLFLFGAAGFPDPEGLMEGSGSVVRHIKLREGAAMLNRPGVRALMDATLERAGRPFDAPGEEVLVIKSVSARHRPRRP